MMPARDLGCGKYLEQLAEGVAQRADMMMDLAEAKLLGYWAPREGQKTDALFMLEAGRRLRQREACDLEYHWRRLRELGFFTKPSQMIVWRNA